MTTKPKTKEEAAKRFADEVTEGVPMPAKVRVSLTLSFQEAFLAGCEFIEKKLPKILEEAYEAGYIQGAQDE